MKRFVIKFQYADEMSKWEWKDQSCSLYAKDESEAVNKCVNLYGLNYGCDYRIVSVKEV